MSNLFIVRNYKNNKLLQLKDRTTVYFERKAAAKVARKAANGVDEEGNERFSEGWTVSKGPDHRLV